jgi:predicted naringenin-chalcone synthase
MKLRLWLRDFRVLPAPYFRPQEESYGWLASAHARARAMAGGHREVTGESVERMERHVRRYSCPKEHVGFRRSELQDFTHTDWGQMQVFKLDESSHGQELIDRNRIFSEVADKRLMEFFEAEVNPPSDLLHVTCTGYTSPSAIQRLISFKGWHGVTRATQVYHMGCYAAIPALRIAAGLLSCPQPGVPPRAEIIHTELCTLHFNPGDHSPEQIVVQSLFADGHARYSMVPDGHTGARGAFELLAVREEVIPGSLADMTWVVSDHGFRMRLSRDVPGRIASALPDFLHRLSEASGGGSALRQEAVVFAVHPGGPRILDSIQELLRLGEWQIAHSRAVLYEFGNMSSATLPHIWAGLAQDEDIPAGTLVVSLAFGPGLTIAAAVFRKC